MRVEACKHVAELLPAYLNRSLEPATTELVEAHLARCEGCRVELEEWQEVAQASRVTMQPAGVPSSSVLNRAMATIDVMPPASEQVSVRPSARHLWQVLLGQRRLIQAYLWPASVVVMALGFVVAATGQLGGPNVVLQLIAPIVAATGVSLIYGPEVDPSLELVLAAPTSPGLILLARLSLVFGYDLVLALAASVGLTAIGVGGGFWTLSLDWLGPMVFLSALALVLSLRMSSSVAMSVALVLWTTRVIVTMETAQRVFDDRVTFLLTEIWSTNLITLLGAAVLLAVALTSLRTQEQLA